MKDDPRRFDVGRRGSGMLALVALGLMAAFVFGVLIYTQGPVERPRDDAAAAAAEKSEAAPAATGSDSSAGE